MPPAYDDGAMLFEATLQQGLEGMVSKRRASRYEFGARSKAWLKFPHRRRASFVVGGWRLETDSQNRIGALLVGEPVEGGGFIYRGRVGSGIAGAKARKLEEVLAPLARDTSPFSDEVPRVDAARHPVGGARAGGRRRVPGPLDPAAAAAAGVPGLAHRPRPGRPAAVSPGSQEVRVDVEGRTLKLSNLEKVYYPRTGTTKGEVLNYYAQVAPVMLPLLKDRAVTRVRWPNGVEQQSFFEKNTPAGTPSWVRTARVPTTGSRGPSRHGDELVFPIVDDLATLTWMVNLAAIELHVHQWTVTKAGKPRGANRLVIDLDPGEGAGLHECCQVALLVRDKLAERDLDAEAVTSGSKGLHLYAALTKRLDPDDSTALAKEVAEELAKEHAKLVTATMTKARRSGKVFLDWSQNAGSKTTLSPYSLRGRELPTVATPVTWAEVEDGAEDPLGLEQFRFEEVLERLEGRDDGRSGGRLSVLVTKALIICRCSVVLVRAAGAYISARNLPGSGTTGGTSRTWHSSLPASVWGVARRDGSS